MRGVFGLAGLIVMWSLTLTAGVVHMVRMVSPEHLVGAVFLGLGWVAGFALPGCGSMPVPRPER